MSKLSYVHVQVICVLSSADAKKFAGKCGYMHVFFPQTYPEKTVCCTPFLPSLGIAGNVREGEAGGELGRHIRLRVPHGVCEGSGFAFS